MIALLLATQITAAALPQGFGLETIPPPRGVIVSPRPAEILRSLPNKGCATDRGRLEVSMAQPTALLRKGDRPGKSLKRWVDYPNGQLCLVETGP